MLNNARLPLSWRSRVALLALLTLSAMSHAASFDCGKARRPLEKFICSQPELDAYKPEPFPAGKLCDLDAPLKPDKGGIKTDWRPIVLNSYEYSRA